MQIGLDGLEIVREQVFGIEFVESLAKSFVRCVAGGEEILIAVVEVLRDFVGNFLFAGGREFQRSDAAEDFGFPAG